MGANRIYKWDPATKQVSVFLEKSGFSGNDLTQVRTLDNGRLMVAPLGSNGIAVDKDGRLVFCTHGDRSIVRLEKDGKRTTLVDRFEGKRLNGPNDIAVKSDGSIYFSDLGAGLRGGAAKSPDRELDFQGAFRWKPDGSVQVVTKTTTNGIAFSPDEKYAYTTGAGVLRYEVQPDGTLASPTKFVENRQADGIKVDSHGFVYGSHGWIANPAGKVIGAIKLPDGDNPTNVAFGDADGRGLYFTTLRSLYYVRMNRPAW
jgi:gluconolactonase